ncbi:MAG: Inhibitor of apoptosis-promoting Bax1 [bacterium ADurb.Bin425]|nr:MAG: Inhibitor of apoptosis-promoting Bax1 [bacterium ADurb.Bin425]
MFPTLFTKVMFLLMCSLGVTSIGVYLGRHLQSLFAMIVLGITFFIGTFVVYFAAGVSPAVGISLLLGWTFVSGLFLGPTIEMYGRTIGWQAVFLCFAGTTGAMALFGAIGMFSGIDFSGLGTYLMFGLFGLIIFGVVGIFVRMSRTVNILHAIFGLVIFSGYFLFDFFRLTKGEDTWPEAVRLTMSLYLDFINFFLYLLQLYAETQK